MNKKTKGALIISIIIFSLGIILCLDNLERDKYSENSGRITGKAEGFVGWAWDCPKKGVTITETTNLTNKYLEEIGCIERWVE